MMYIQHLSTMLAVPDLIATQVFYTNYFGGELIFETPAYHILEFPDSDWRLHLMQSNAQIPATNGQGVCLNMKVADVNMEYERLVAQRKCSVAMPLEDHHWGDRGFSILDPNGVSIYIYSIPEPSMEYARSYPRGR